MAELDTITSEVMAKHRFDEQKLDEYLSTHLPGFSSKPGEALTVRQYRSGQSRAMFFLQKGPNKFVLRKKPHHPVIPGDNLIERAYEVQTALFAAGFPVPKTLLYCNDMTVIGTEFYVMAHVEGRIFRDVFLVNVHPEERSALFVAIIETLSRLHSYNIHKLNLTGYGQGKGYCQREARVIAVLDWELSTIGNPISDLAYFLIVYFWPSEEPIYGGDKSLGDIEGIPPYEDLMSIYCRRRGVDSPVHDWNFFLALNCFKIVGLVQEIHARSLRGHSREEDTIIFANMVKPLAEKGLILAKCL
ncbi:acyl-CoA dehydrogenase family member 11-like isoform X2 [Lithobates pipiens]